MRRRGTENDGRVSNCDVSSPAPPPSSAFPYHSQVDKKAAASPKQARPRPPLKICRMDRRTSQPAARSRQPARAEDAARGAARSERVSKLIGQLHYNYSLKAEQLRSSSAAPSSLHVEQRYLQWRDFWMAASSSSSSSDAVSQQPPCTASFPDRLRDDAAKIERLLAFTNDCSRSGSTAGSAQTRRSSSLPPLTVPFASAHRDEASSPHSPAYYANLARFIACAPHPPAFPSRPSHGKRRDVASHSAPQATGAAATHDSEPSHSLPPAPAAERKFQQEETAATGKQDDAEKAGDEAVIEIVIVEHRAEPAAAAASTQAVEEEETAPADCSATVPSPPCPAAPASCSPPLVRPCGAYSFTELPRGRECIRPGPAAAASSSPSSSSASSSSSSSASRYPFSLDSLFARMSIPQLLRYLSALNPSALSCILPSSLSKQQLIHLACSLYRSSSGRLSAASGSAAACDRQRERVAEEMQRLYGHLPLQALLQTVLQWEDKSRPPVVRRGDALGAGEQAVERAWRRCMLAVHPDKHAAGSERVLQLRCEELYRLIQSRMADWKLRHGR